MEKFEIEINLEHVAQAKAQAIAANREFLNRIDKVMVRLIHEAAAKRMSISEVAGKSGFTVQQIKSRMRAMDLNPTTGKALLSRQAASVLEHNAEIMGVHPHEIDLMSPLAYLPAGPHLKVEDTTVKEFPETPLVHTMVSGVDDLPILACEYHDRSINTHDTPVLICDDINQISCPECRVQLGLKPLAERPEAGA